jgi:hypothetical protein
MGNHENRSGHAQKKQYNIWPAVSLRTGVDAVEQIETGSWFSNQNPGLPA